MMKSLIVYAHPWDGSFNKSILENIKNSLTTKGNIVDVIDLNKDGFNPLMTTEDLRLFGRGEYADPIARDYVERIKATDEIIFIYPIWWYGEPSVLSGFFEKVFLKGQVYTQQGSELLPLLNIKKSTVLTTASVTKEVLEQYGDPINARIINGVFAKVGIYGTTWLHCGMVHEESARLHYIKEIATHFA